MEGSGLTMAPVPGAQRGPSRQAEGHVRPYPLPRLGQNRPFQPAVGEQIQRRQHPRGIGAPAGQSRLQGDPLAYPDLHPLRRQAGDLKESLGGAPGGVALIVRHPLVVGFQPDSRLPGSPGP